MSENKSGLKPDQILDLMIKERWYIIFFFIMTMLTGMYFTITLPRIYQSSTLIDFQPQQIVPAVNPTGLIDRVQNISQKILSRSNLERIIREFRLYEEAENKTMYMEDKIADLRKRIEVEVITDPSRRTDAFTIAFKGQDPEKVMNVVNTLASHFIEQNLEMTEMEATDTSKFLKTQLEEMKARLEKAEKAIAHFRNTHMGKLPEQLDSNLRIYERLQEQLSERERRLSAAKMHLMSLQDIFSTASGSSAGNGNIAAHPAAELAQLHGQLIEMSSRYTDAHPDIIRLKERIANLEAAAANEPQGRKAVGPVYRGSLEYQSERREIQREITSLKNDITTAKAQIEFYRKRIESTPKAENQLVSLKRDYQTIQTQYNSLLERQLDAEEKKALVVKNKGEQFRIIDPAQAATKPIEPDVNKLFLMFVAIGLGAGGLIIFIKEYIRISFKNPGEIESELKLQVLGTIPKIVAPAAQRWKRLDYGLSLCSALFCLVLLGGYAALTFLGVDATLVVVEKIINLRLL